MDEPGPVPPRGSGPAFFRRKEIVVLVGMLAFIALALTGGVYYLQTPLAFPHPPRAAERLQELASAHGEQLWLDVNGERVEAWFLPGATHDPAPLIINTHGNGELIDFWAEPFRTLRDSGIHVLLVE